MGIIMGKSRKNMSWLLIFTIMCGWINPARFVTAGAERNWEVEYSLGIDDTIPLSLEDDRIVIEAQEGELVTIGMTLAEGSQKSSRRFNEKFTIEVPDRLYNLMMEHDSQEMTVMLEDSSLESGYLLEAVDDVIKTASDSDASSSNASGSNTKKLKGGSHALTFQFVEELKKAEQPGKITIEDTTGGISFVAPESMVLILTQDGNDCQLAVKEPAIMAGNRAKALEGINFDMKICQNNDYENLTDSVVWDPSSNYNASTSMTLYIDYEITTEKEYAPGELKITVNGFPDTLGEYWESLTSSQGRTTVTIGEGIWEAEFDKTTREVTFYNKEPLGNGSGEGVGGANSSGHVEITWTVSAKQKAGEYEFQAVISENIEGQENASLTSDTCTFEVVKDTKASTQISKTAKNADEAEVKAIYKSLPEDSRDDYMWVAYDLNRYFSDYAEIMLADYRIVDPLPKGCVVFDSDFNQVTLNENNEYVEDATLLGSWDSYKSHFQSTIYVGYPIKTETNDGYEEGDIITNEFSIYGRYEDEETYEYLKETDCNVSLVEFDFTYSGELYGVRKSTDAKPVYLDHVTYHIGNQTRTKTIFNIDTVAVYKDRPMEVCISDDVLYITRADGSTSMLAPHEYYFESMTIPVFSDLMGNTLTGNSYTLEVKTLDQDTYHEYQNGVLEGGAKVINFQPSEAVTAWRLVLHEVEISIHNGTITTAVDVAADHPGAGYLRNFCGLEVHIDEVFVNEPTRDSYLDSAKELADYDQDTYGYYIQRDEAEIGILAPIKNAIEVDKYAYSSAGTIVENEQTVYLQKYSLTARTGMSNQVWEDGYLSELTMYDILPEGVYFDSILSTKYLFANGERYISSTKLQDGTVLDSKAAIQTYMKNRTIINLIHDYQGSGRTKIEITLDLSDNPLDLNETAISTWNMESLASDVFNWIDVNIQTKIPWDSLDSKKGSIKNDVYLEADATLGDGSNFVYKNKKTDNGKQGDALAEDINENGASDDEFSYDSVSNNIPYAGSSHQDVKKMVRTSGTNGQFITTRGKAELDEEYTYRLQIRTGKTPVKGLVFYDTIETIFEGDNNIADWWKGTFLTVDTTYAESQGFVPVIYYSSDLEPGSLYTHPGDWIVYTDSVAPENIKSIAIDLRYGAGSQELEVAANQYMYVDIHMQTPAVMDTRYAKNMYTVDWIEMDEKGNTTGEIVTLPSNIVSVELQEKVIPNVDLKLTKVKPSGDPITSHSATFALSYDAAGLDKVYRDGTPVTLTTRLTDGTVSSGLLTLDSDKERYDGSYHLYLIETDAPEGYQKLNTVIRVELKPDANGGYVISPTKETGVYDVKAGENNEILITVTNKKIVYENVEIAIEAKKQYNRSLDGDDFTFAATLVTSPEDATATYDGTVITKEQGRFTTGNDIDGKVKFADIVLDTPGIYVFEIAEIVDSSKQGYITYDESKYYVSVEVGVQGNQLVIISPIAYYEDKACTKEKNQGISFENTYIRTPLGDVQLELKKLLEYQDGTKYEGKLPEFEFKMEPYEDYGNRITMPQDTGTTNQSDGTIVFDAITFHKEGTYKFKIREIDPGDDGIVYDPVVIIATVIIEDNGSGGLYLKDDTILYHNSENPGKPLDEFVNELIPVTTESGKGRFEAFKKYVDLNQNELTMTPGMFEFQVTLLEVQEGAEVTKSGIALVKDVPVKLGEHDGNGNVIFDDLTFDKAGTYVFAIEEIEGDKNYIGYSKQVYYAKVTVAVPKGEKALTVAVTYYEDEALENKIDKTDVIITNSYQPIEASINLELNKQLIGADGTEVKDDIPKYAFTIELDSNTDPDNHVIMPTNVTVYNQPDGSITFDSITFQAEGDYKFIIRETNSGIEGVVYDTAVITITVPVRDVNHVLSIHKDDVQYIKSETVSAENNKTFVNQVKPISEELEANKTLSGKPLETGNFVFEAKLVESSEDAAVICGNQILTATGSNAVRAVNQADGSVTFGALEFQHTGDYVFEICEIAGTDADIQYDSTIYYALVRITVNETTRELEKTIYYYKDRELTKPIGTVVPSFENSYVVTVDLDLNKKLLNAIAVGDETLTLTECYIFELLLVEGEGDFVNIPNHQTTNAADGKIAFHGIEIKEEGVYRFAIKEVVPQNMPPGHTEESFDPGTIYATVSVSKVNGTLTVGEVSYQKELGADQGQYFDKDDKEHTFVNFLIPETGIDPETVTLLANKTLVGRPLVNEEFMFQSELIYTSTGVDIAAITANNNSNGVITFPEYTFTEAGTYIFKITEVAGSDSSIHYTDAAYYAKVVVTANRIGKLKTEWYYGSSYDYNTHEVGGRLSAGQVPEYENTVNGTVTIKKVSKSSGTPLKGAQFKLFYRIAGSEDSWAEYGSVWETGGADGSISFQLMEQSWQYEFKLVETKAPNGYSKSKVGNIFFRVAKDGSIAALTNDGTTEYVELSEDRTTILVKNHSSGGSSGGGEDPKPPTDPTNPTDPTSPTDPTNPTDPTTPTDPQYPTLPHQPDPENPGIVVPPGDVVVKDPDGNIVWEGNTPDGHIDIDLPPGRYEITVIGDDGVPLTYIMDVNPPMAGLAKTGDERIPAAAMLVMMIVAMGGILCLNNRKYKEQKN